MRELKFTDLVAISNLIPLNNLWHCNSIELAEKGLSTEQIYNIQHSSCGYIVIWKDDGFRFEGWCAIFAEGVSLYIDAGNEWYRTSNIESINWNSEYFTTQNSKYYFKLDNCLHIELDEWAKASIEVKNEL